MPAFFKVELKIVVAVSQVSYLPLVIVRELAVLSLFEGILTVDPYGSGGVHTLELILRKADADLVKTARLALELISDPLAVGDPLVAAHGISVYLGLVLGACDSRSAVVYRVNGVVGNLCRGLRLKIYGVRVGALVAFFPVLCENFLVCGKLFIGIHADLREVSLVAYSVESYGVLALFEPELERISVIAVVVLYGVGDPFLAEIRIGAKLVAGRVHFENIVSVGNIVGSVLEAPYLVEVLVSRLGIRRFAVELEYALDVRGFFVLGAVLEAYAIPARLGNIDFPRNGSALADEDTVRTVNGRFFHIRRGHLGIGHVIRCGDRNVFSGAHVGTVVVF